MKVIIKLDDRNSVVHTIDNMVSYFQIPYYCDQSKWLLYPQTQLSTNYEIIKFMLVPIDDETALAVCAQEDILKFDEYKREMLKRIKLNKRLNDERL